jgi:hypothetical protein
MAIGAIAPSLNTSCIRNITIENFYTKKALHAAYIKTTPNTRLNNDEGFGIVDGITFR